MMLLLMVPALLVVVVLLVVPLGWLLWESVYHDGGFTLANYRRIFTGAYLDTFLLTFKLSFVVTAITLLPAIPSPISPPRFRRAGVRSCSAW